MLTIETLFNIGISVSFRVAFLCISRVYVKQTLLADLQVITNDESQSEDDASNDGDPSVSMALLASSRTPLSSPSLKPSHRLGLHRTNTDIQRTSRLYPRLATLIFCYAFSESCMLCTLVLVGNWLTERTMWLNWDFSLGSSLAIICLVAPFGQCLMITSRRRRSADGKSTLTWMSTLMTLTLFGAYETALIQGGYILSKIVGVNESSSTTFGIIGIALERICVPGVLLIAMLSGAGAVNTAWDAYEWRQRFRGRPITEATVSNCESALHKAKEDLHACQRELAALESAQGSSQSSFFSRLLTTNASEKEARMLRMEIAGLRLLEEQMMRDLASLKSRKRTMELSGTIQGKLFSMLGVAFTWYCVLRVALTAVGLVFGLDAPSSTSNSNNAGLVSRLLTTLLSLVGVTVNMSYWSHVISLALTGAIIVVNMSTVLRYVSSVLRSTSAGVSASFMLLSIAQLMSTYFLTSLISLPDSGEAETHALLRSLPDFVRFARLFDASFLVAAIGWAVARFVECKVRADEFPMGGVV